MHPVDNAIIMASGQGTRLRPLTLQTPKPLIRIANKPMIETVLDALCQRKVRDIAVVVGYLSEQFSYLAKKYPNVQLIQNRNYANENNISSVYAAKQLLRENHNCFICEADLWVSRPELLDLDIKHSCYFGRQFTGYCDDWVLEQDAQGRLTRVGKGGHDCYALAGISYFTAEDARLLADFIETAYSYPENRNKFWDEIVNERLDSLDMTVHVIRDEDIHEIDTIEELAEMRARYGG